MRPKLTVLPCPVPQSDLIQATLVIPLHAVGEEHVGRKLRLTVQIIDVDPTGTYALVTGRPGTRCHSRIPPREPSVSSTPPASPTAPSSSIAPSPPTSYYTAASSPPPETPPTSRPTLVVNLTTALLGLSPGATHAAFPAFAPSPATVSLLGDRGVRVDVPPLPTIPRRRLNLTRGEWICVVGWLEISNSEVAAPPGFSDPLDAVLEAIFVSPAREPPLGPMIGEM